MKKIRYLTICVLLVLIACTYYKLAGRLPDEVKDWYMIHSPLMGCKVPEWIDANNRTEAHHFLKMPGYIQEAYIHDFFWQIRQDEARELFYGRLGYAQVHFQETNNPWQSHRGYIYLLAGAPTLERYYRHGTEEVASGMPESGDRLQWYYWDYRIGETSYWFEFHPPDSWRLVMDTGLRGLGNREIFERNCREKFYPTPDGWITYAEYLYEALGDKDG